MVTTYARPNPAANPYLPLALLASVDREALAQSVSATRPDESLVVYVSAPRTMITRGGDELVYTKLLASYYATGYRVAPAPPGYSPANGTLYLLTPQGFKVA